MNRGERGNLDPLAAGFTISKEFAARSEAVALVGGKWFANRGQMLQMAIAAMALVIAGRNAWRALVRR
jgi:hypothetical protein